MNEEKKIVMTEYRELSPIQKELFKAVMGIMSILMKIKPNIRT